MKKYLKITSKSIIPVEAFTLIGASTKRNDTSTIGQFGSGLKYAIAAIIRDELDLKIFTDYKEIKVETKEVNMKEQVFEQIIIDGQPTSLTTGMGELDWKGPWPYIREIYSNALDAGESAITTINIEKSEELVPIEDHTVFYVEANEDCEEIIKNFGSYFVQKSTHLYADRRENYIFTPVGKPGTRIFRKGILVYERKKEEALFHYDISNAKINESRVLVGTYDVRNTIGEMIEGCTDSSVLAIIMSHLAGGNAGSFEHECILPSYYSTKASLEFISYTSKYKFYPIEGAALISDEKKRGRIGHSLKLIKRFLIANPETNVLGITSTNQETSDMFFESVPSEVLLDKVSKSLDLLNNTEYKSRLSLPIKYVRFNSRDVLGRYNNNTVYLSTNLDTYPVDKIAAIIIEEHEHHITGYGDRTRALQTHLFDLYYTHLRVSSENEEKIKKESVADYVGKLPSILRFLVKKTSKNFPLF